MPFAPLTYNPRKVFGPQSFEAQANFVAGNIVFDKMGSWCVANTREMFGARDDIAQIALVRLYAGELVIAEDLMTELELGAEVN